MKRRAWVIFGALVVIIALPMALREKSATTAASDADDRLVILSPQNESIRGEFGEAFAAHWQATTGRSLYVDWRSPGGTSEIRMVIDAGFQAAVGSGRDGIGVDVFFGGGEPDFAGQAKLGRFAKLQVFDEYPEWFGDAAAVPPEFTGERYFPPERTWVGTCLSQFGICYNPDVLKRLHVPHPAAWADLGDPRYAGTIALADPTKSGSVARMFELLVQAEMQRALAVPGAGRDAALTAGWANGLQLIQRMAANARYFTDSATKIPLDVGQGNAAAGMCIDFYGRSYEAELTSRTGTPRLVWVAPVGGTTLSADPVAVFRGAPHPAVAQAFATFCLSEAGQTLWFGKPGTPSGPHHRALYRMPIRRDMYDPRHLANSTMPDAAPYSDAGNFTYRRELTGAAFHTIRQLVKIMCIDSHEEMTAAWRALRDAGMPADAVAVFLDVSRVGYLKMGHGDPVLSGADPLAAAAHAADLGGWFRANYRKAAAMARANPRSKTR